MRQNGNNFGQEQFHKAGKTPFSVTNYINLKILKCTSKNHVLKNTQPSLIDLNFNSGDQKQSDVIKSFFQENKVQI